MFVVEFLVKVENENYENNLCFPKRLLLYSVARKASVCVCVCVCVCVEKYQDLVRIRLTF